MLKLISSPRYLGAPCLDVVECCQTLICVFQPIFVRHALPRVLLTRLPCVLRPCPAFQILSDLVTSIELTGPNAQIVAALFDKPEIVLPSVPFRAGPAMLHCYAKWLLSLKLSIN